MRIALIGFGKMGREIDAVAREQGDAIVRVFEIDDPVTPGALVDADGSATVRQLAQEFLRQDESQLIYYERRIRSMPAKVLKKHGVISQQGTLISLTVSRLSLEQKAELRKICDQRLQDYIVRNGISIWDYRLIDNMGINDDLRFRVLKEAKGRCALCGAPAQFGAAKPQRTGHPGTYRRPGPA